MRVFVGLELSETIKDHLERQCHPTRWETLEGERWTVRRNWHITLAFIGAIDPRRASDLDALLAESALGFEPVSFALDRWGAFPSDHRGHVFWAGTRQSPAPLHRFNEDLTTRLQAAGFTPDMKPLQVHVTLSRAKRALDFRSRLHHAIEPITLQTESFVLFQSETRPEGSEYKVIGRFAKSR